MLLTSKQRTKAGCDLRDERQRSPGLVKYRRNRSIYLWLGLQGRIAVVMSKSIQNRIVIVRCSIQKLVAHRWRPENLFPALRVLVDVLSKRGQWIGFWVPKATTYTERMSSDNASRSSAGQYSAETRDGTAVKSDECSWIRTDKTRAGLKMNIVCCIWAFFTCARPGRDE